MEEVVCNLCGFNKTKHVYSIPDTKYFPDEWFSIVECEKCGLGFVNPRPTVQEIAKYYPETFYQYFENNSHEKRYAVEASYLSGINVANKRILDIGCANGDFPRYMSKLGWDVEGVETSCNSKIITDFQVYYSDFTKIPLDEPRYDAITAWAVLEHVHDPMGYFQKASKVLKKNGIFVFLVTNFNSISSRYLFLEDVPRHLYFFTEETIKQYLKVNGFELLKIDYSNKTYSMRPVNWMRYFLLYDLRSKEFRFNDIPNNRLNYFLENNLSNSIVNTLKYVWKNPLTSVDRMLMPLFEAYQIYFRKYGIVTYVARKC